MLLSENGLTGLSPLEAVRRQISIKYQAENTTEKYYKNNLHSNKYIKSLPGIDLKQYNQGQADWNEQNKGSNNSGTVPTLPYGSEIAELKLEFADAMLLDSIKFNSGQICVMYGLQGWMLGLEEMKYKSIEESLIAFQKTTIEPLAKLFKEAFSNALLTEDERSEGIAIEFDLKAMLASDNITRANYLKTMTSSGIMSLNAAAQIEGYDEFENGDLHFMQSQNIPIEKSMVDGKWSPATNGSVNIISNKD
jgi:HK97 family phage portal protein